MDMDSRLISWIWIAKTILIMHAAAAAQCGGIVLRAALIDAAEDHYDNACRAAQCGGITVAYLRAALIALSPIAR